MKLIAINNFEKNINDKFWYFKNVKCKEVCACYFYAYISSLEW